MQARITTLLSVTSFALILGGCASTPQQAAKNNPQKGDRHVQIAAGKSVELNLDVPTSAMGGSVHVDPIIVTFAASAPVNWNVSSRPYGDGVEVLVQGSDAAHVIEHTPYEPGPISLLWENRSDSPIRATFRVNGLPAGTTAVWVSADAD